MNPFYVCIEKLEGSVSAHVYAVTVSDKVSISNILEDPVELHYTFQHKTIQVTRSALEDF